MRRAPSVQDYERMTEPARASAAEVARIYAATIAAQREAAEHARETATAEAQAAKEAHAAATEQRRLAEAKTRLIKARRQAAQVEKERLTERMARRAKRVQGTPIDVAADAERHRLRAIFRNNDTPERTAIRCHELDVITTRRQDAA